MKNRPVWDSSDTRSSCDGLLHKLYAGVMPRLQTRGARPVRVMCMHVLRRSTKGRCRRRRLAQPCLPPARRVFAAHREEVKIPLENTSYSVDYCKVSIIMRWSTGVEGWGERVGCLEGIFWLIALLALDKATCGISTCRRRICRTMVLASSGNKYVRPDNFRIVRCAANRNRQSPKVALPLLPAFCYAQQRSS